MNIEWFRSLPNVSLALEDQISDVRSALTAAEFKVYRLSGITSVEDFFLHVRDDLPMAPPISGQVHWDAFSDSLWGGLDETGDERIAIFWENADQLLMKDSESFQIAIEIFSHVASSLANPQFNADKLPLLKIFMFGAGSEFPRLFIGS